jgi:CHASE2 domain-containing sensor protein
VSATEGPYVGLDYFVEGDAERFFGRDGERKRIIGNLQASRLTLLYAESGVGKTSLLRAGVAARLRHLAAQGEAPYVPVVFSSWRGNPTPALIAAIEAALQPLIGEDRLQLPRDGLEDAIERVTRSAPATPLVILDQFEEHFLYDPGDGDPFDDELARCLSRRDLRANFLISVREDAYSLIGPRFKARIPDVYGNYLHLDFLGEAAAREAIVKPLVAFNDGLGEDGQRVDIEPELVEAVLAQVQRGRVVIGDRAAPDGDTPGAVRVETAYLQLVMKRLWDEERASGSSRLRLETLERLGGADTIVRGHLDDVLAKLTDDQRDAAAAGFRFLVTSGGRKIALSSTELREFSGVEAAALEPALAHLERERILRPVPSDDRDGAGRHEIYHDVLAPAVLDWRRRHVEEQQRVETESRLAEARDRAGRLETRNRRLSAAVIALTAIAIGLALFLWDPGPVQKLELGTIDTRFSIRGSSGPDPRTLLVAVDDRTLRRFGAPRTARLPRAQYAPLLRRIHEDDPDVIALDVIFQGPTDTQNDRALIAAVRDTSDRLVLPYADFDVTTDPQTYQTTASPTLFGRPGAVEARRVTTGYAGLPDDRDGVDRRAEYEVVAGSAYPARPAPSQRADGGSDEDVTMPTFAFAAANLARHGALARQMDGLPTAPRRAWGGQTDRTTWIDFRGPGGTVRRVSAIDVLDGRVPAREFRDKAVVIGVVTPAANDIHRTPLDGDMPGAEVQADAIGTMLGGSPLRDVPPLVNIVIIALLACAPVAAALWWSTPVVAGVVAACVVVLLAAAQLAFQSGWIVAVVVPLVALGAAALGVATVSVVRLLLGRRGERAATVD